MRRYLFHNKLMFGAVLFSRILQIGIFMYFSILVRDFINIALENPAKDDFYKQSAIALAYCAIHAVTQQLAGVLTTQYINKTIYLLRKDYFETIMKAPYQQVMKNTSAQYISHLTNDLNIISKDYVSAFFSCIGNVLTIVFVIIYGCLLTLDITVIMIVLAILLVVLPFFFTRNIDKKNYNLSTSYDKFLSSIKDVLSGYSTVKVNHSEAVMMEQVNRTFFSVSAAESKKDNTIISLSTSTSFVGNAIKLLLVIVAAYCVSKNKFDVGTITAILTLSGTFYSCVMDMSTFIGSMAGTKAIRMKLCRLMRYEKCENNPLVPVDGNITLSHVNFSYNSNRQILDDITFEFEKGGKYLIIGSSGSGKSTLLRVISMLNKNQSGSIRFGETDYGKISFQQLINKVTYVQQNEFLFDTTLKNNIDLNRTGDDAKIEECVKRCQLVELINKLPNKLDTQVNAEIDKISEGEKLRIVLARALYKGGDYFLFDEITSALDSINSREIEKMILQMPATVLNVCHNLDLELMQLYDNIIIIENGAIIASGKYDELLDCGLLQKYIKKKEC